MEGLLAVAVLAMLATCAQAGLYTENGPVVNLDPTNFKSKIKSGGVWMVEFYAPWCGHCKSLQPEWEKAAGALRGVAGVAAVDADAHQALGAEYEVKGFPTIKLMYADEKGKIKVSEYNGGRTAKDIVTFAADKAKSLALKRLGEKPSAGGGSAGAGGGGEKKAPSGGGGGGGGGNDPFYGGTDVVVLTDANFDDMVTNSPDLWFVEFYAPWCGHCKNLKPEYIEAATSLKGKVKMGAVNCDDHKTACGKFDVKGFPTIKFFGANKRRPEDFNGARDAAAMVAFGKTQWSAVAPPPEVVELVDAAAFVKQCVGNDKVAAKQLCVLAFLPDILDSKATGRNAYIKSLKKVAEAFKDRPFSYLWVEGGRQEALEAGLRVGGFGYPTAVVLNPKEKKFASLKGAFSEASIKDWIDTIRKGGAAVELVEGGVLPEVHSVAAWDGKDAAIEEEEEFSLDDIMNE